MKLIYQKDSQEIICIQHVDWKFLYVIHHPMPESVASHFLASPINNKTNKKEDFFWRK